MLEIVIFCEVMMARLTRLKPKQLNAIRLLATGTPAYQVAETLEVSVMTVYRWQRLPEFEQTLNSMSHSGLDEIAKKMNVAALTSIETLQEILCDMGKPANVRLQAALGTLKVMAVVNGALEKSVQHRIADFDTRKRFSGPNHIYDSSGQPIPILGPHSTDAEDPAAEPVVV